MNGNTNVRWLTWGRCAVCVLLSAAISLPQGCGGSFLGLQDYQRDLLLFGALANALLGNGGLADSAGNGDPDAGQDLPATEPIPGADGLNCWDLNGDGIGDANEDINSDGAFDALDCRGADGAGGAPGVAGADGVDGAPGAQGPAGNQGPAGAAGASGSQGPAGPAGPENFDLFVDDFFGNAGENSISVELVRIEEPYLGEFDDDQTAGVFSSSLAFRMTVPRAYDSGNDVTMRLSFFRTGRYDGDCLIFKLAARRMRNNEPGPQCYGGDPFNFCEQGLRWIAVNPPRVPVSAGDEGDLYNGAYLVIDLPVNTAAGLGLPNDLRATDLLAFELATDRSDGGLYQILAVEFFESPAGSATTVGADVFFPGEDPICPCEGEGPDCNENGRTDDCDIDDGRSLDCNGNQVPDECEVCGGGVPAGGAACPTDCDRNGIPDDCDPDADQDGTPDACEPPCVCHADVLIEESPTENTTASIGAVVFYDLPQTDDVCDFECIGEDEVTAGKETCEVICSPSSGSFFPPGQTTVTCESLVSGDGEDECSFTVTVIFAPEIP